VPTGSFRILVPRSANAQGPMSRMETVHRAPSRLKPGEWLPRMLTNCCHLCYSYSVTVLM
jgi:hypothetical protein